MDYSEEGGAVMLGVNKPVIKAHGSSDAKAFYNAIRQAKACVDGHVTQTIIDSIGK
jgi:glycerol-3-phosphate acyltransferase PlsX